MRMNMADRTREDAAIRKDFPLLANHPELAYLDSAATSQKPSCVLRVEQEFYETCNANPFRGLYALSVDATDRYEAARRTVQEFVGAAEPAEIIFTRNATESLNLVAYSWGSHVLQPGDEILVNIAEHHSNLIPWQQAAARTGAVLKYLECGKDGEITEEMMKNALTERTKIVATAQVSNVFGRVNDLAMITRLAHEKGAVVVADGAQSVPHMPVNVAKLDVDFLVFSGHKMLAPMGIGVLYGKKALLEAMPPFLCGGEMIDSVNRTGAVFAPLPHKFEAGTVNAAGAVALGEAIRYIQALGFDKIQEREDALTAQAFTAIKAIPGVTLLGADNAAEHHGILTFKVEGVHPHDVAAILDADGVAVRAGHHCAQPLHQYLGIPSTTRASIAFYNTAGEIKRFTDSLGRVRKEMGYAE